MSLKQNNLKGLKNQKKYTTIYILVKLHDKIKNLLCIDAVEIQRFLS